MKSGGVDPSILRELSGVYKPFIKAFKELISNSFDADADTVKVEFDDQFSTVTIADDGQGMSPFDFRFDFTRIGGSGRRWTKGKTPKGRLRIGNKGIGFLALARYCGQMEVKSSRTHTFKYQIESEARSIDIMQVLGIPISSDLLKRYLKLKVRKKGQRTILGEGNKYKVDWKRKRISIAKDTGTVEIEFSINCRNLVFTAAIDFRRLLKLADSADLDKLNDFTEIDVEEVKNAPNGTTVTIRNLKPFVRKELRAGQRQGFVRNVASRSGYEQFKWFLSRCTPIAYVDSDPKHPAIKKLVKANSQKLDQLLISHGTDQVELRRPAFLLEPDAPILNDMIFPIDIRKEGLRAVGYLCGCESVVYPAEYRGIAIRVRGVAIGEPTFLGAEFLLTGAQKAALSQITGEINVTAGLDAVDALNPGRESFYEESKHYNILKEFLIGDGERVSGCLGQTISAVLRRSQVRSSMNALLGRVGHLRRATDDVSAGVSYLMARGGGHAKSIRSMLSSNKSHTNGLASAKPYKRELPPRVAGMKIVKAKNLTEAVEIDYDCQEIQIDVARPEWNEEIVLHNREFKLVHKLGEPNQPIAEIDFKDNRILINWGHPAKAQMDERGFLRTALSWVLSKSAAAGDADQMMDLAVTLLSFTSNHENR